VGLSSTGYGNGLSALDALAGDGLLILICGMGTGMVSCRAGRVFSLDLSVAGG
jgi:hypothetical protein